MPCAARMDTVGYRDWHGPPRALMRAGWIALMVLGFIVWWPIGLAILALTLWSKNMNCWGHRGGGRWRRKMQRMEEAMERHYGRHAHPSSGNRAFDEYREETLRRLEDEQREFRDFLERLRAAKDKAEFDLFMNERRNSPPPPERTQPQS